MLKTFLLLLFISAHPVHVSLMSIEYSADDLSFNVFMKLYYDDFILDAGESLLYGDVTGFPVHDSVPRSGILRYIDEKIDICANDQRLRGRLDSVTLADNELSINMKFDSVTELDCLTIRNRVMIDLYEDQANMIIVRVNDFEEGVKLTPSVTEKTFKIR